MPLLVKPEDKSSMQDRYCSQSGYNAQTFNSPTRDVDVEDFQSEALGVYPEPANPDNASQLQVQQPCFSASQAPVTAKLPITHAKTHGKVERDQIEEVNLTVQEDAEPRRHGPIHTIDNAVADDGGLMLIAVIKACAACFKPLLSY